MEQQSVRPIPPEHRRLVGMRIIKTVVAVFLCGLLAFLRSTSGFYSMIAAVVCIQNSAGKTIESSINRMTGTLIGGVAGVLVVYGLDTLGVLYIELLRYVVLSLMLIPIIKLCLAIKKPGCAAMACIVFLCVTVNHSIGDTPAVYSIDRLFETLVGVALACGIDSFCPTSPRPSPLRRSPRRLKRRPICRKRRKYPRRIRNSLSGAPWKRRTKRDLSGHPRRPVPGPPQPFHRTGGAGRPGGNRPREKHRPVPGAAHPRGAGLAGGER